VQATPDMFYQKENTSEKVQDVLVLSGDEDDGVHLLNKTDQVLSEDDLNVDNISPNKPGKKPKIIGSKGLSKNNNFLLSSKGSKVIDSSNKDIENRLD
jgi:hypothetical protein